jgi:hypothetical protein
MIFETKSQEELLMKYWRRNSKAILATMGNLMRTNPELGRWEVYHPDFIVTVTATPDLMQRKEIQKIDAKVKSI